MIALRADDDVDCRCTADDLFALGLGHATRNRDHHSAPFPGRRLFERAHAAKFGIDFFRRLLADMAGIENDEIGLRHACRLDKTFGRERVRHTMRIVDVHLAAKGFNVNLACPLHSSGQLAGFAAPLTFYAALIISVTTAKLVIAPARLWGKPNLSLSPRLSMTI